MGDAFGFADDGSSFSSGINALLDNVRTPETGSQGKRCRPVSARGKTPPTDFQRRHNTIANSNSSSRQSGQTQQQQQQDDQEYQRQIYNQLQREPRRTRQDVKYQQQRRQQQQQHKGNSSWSSNANFVPSIANLSMQGIGYGSSFPSRRSNLSRDNSPTMSSTAQRSTNQYGSHGTHSQIGVNTDDRYRGHNINSNRWPDEVRNFPEEARGWNASNSQGRALGNVGSSSSSGRRQQQQPDVVDVVDADNDNYDNDNYNNDNAAAGGAPNLFNKGQDQSAPSVGAGVVTYESVNQDNEQYRNAAPQHRYGQKQSDEYGYGADVRNIGVSNLLKAQRVRKDEVMNADPSSTKQANRAANTNSYSNLRAHASSSNETKDITPRLGGWDGSVAGNNSNQGQHSGSTGAKGDGSMQSGAGGHSSDDAPNRSRKRRRKSLEARDTERDRTIIKTRSPSVHLIDDDDDGDDDNKISSKNAKSESEEPPRQKQKKKAIHDDEDKEEHESSSLSSMFNVYEKKFVKPSEVHINGQVYTSSERRSCRAGFQRFDNGPPILTINLWTNTGEKIEFEVKISDHRVTSLGFAKKTSLVLWKINGFSKKLRGPEGEHVPVRKREQGGEDIILMAIELDVEIQAIDHLKDAKKKTSIFYDILQEEDNFHEKASDDFGEFASDMVKKHGKVGNGSSPYYKTKQSGKLAEKAMKKRHLRNRDPGMMTVESDENSDCDGDDEEDERNDGGSSGAGRPAVTVVKTVSKVMKHVKRICRKAGGLRNDTVMIEPKESESAKHTNNSIASATGKRRARKADVHKVDDSDESNSESGDDGSEAFEFNGSESESNNKKGENKGNQKMSANANAVESSPWRTTHNRESVKETQRKKKARNAAEKKKNKRNNRGKGMGTSNVKDQQTTLKSFSSPVNNASGTNKRITQVFQRQNRRVDNNNNKRNPQKADWIWELSDKLKSENKKKSYNTDLAKDEYIDESGNNSDVGSWGGNGGNSKRKSTRLSLKREKENPELTKEEKEARNIGNETMLLTYPLAGGPGAVVVRKGDRARCYPGEFLNDSVVDFYLRYFMEVELPKRLNADDLKEVLASVHLFNSFFFKRLTEGVNRDVSDEVQYKMRTHVAGFANVRRWTRKVDIFSKRFLVIPIVEHLHWSLAIVCNPAKVVEAAAAVAAAGDEGCASNGIDIGNDDKPKEGEEQQEMSCIILMDSLDCHSKSRISKYLRQYLNFAWKEKNEKIAKNQPVVISEFKSVDDIFTNTRLPVIAPCIPSQTNSCDCGVFILEYAERFVELIPSFILHLEDLRDQLHQYVEKLSFKLNRIPGKRRTLLKLIDQLHAEYKKDHMNDEAAGGDDDDDDDVCEAVADGNHERNQVAREKAGEAAEARMEALKRDQDETAEVNGSGNASSHGYGADEYDAVCAADPFTTGDSAADATAHTGSDAANAVVADTGGGDGDSHGVQLPSVCTAGDVEVSAGADSSDSIDSTETAAAAAAADVIPPSHADRTQTGCDADLDVLLGADVISDGTGFVLGDDVADADSNSDGEPDGDPTDSDAFHIERGVRDGASDMRTDTGAGASVGTNVDVGDGVGVDANDSVDVEDRVAALHMDIVAVNDGANTATKNTDPPKRFTRSSRNTKRPKMQKSTFITESDDDEQSAQDITKPVEPAKATSQVGPALANLGIPGRAKATKTLKLRHKSSSPARPSTKHNQSRLCSSSPKQPQVKSPSNRGIYSINSSEDGGNEVQEVDASGTPQTKNRDKQKVDGGAVIDSRYEALMESLMSPESTRGRRKEQQKAKKEEKDEQKKNKKKRMVIDGVQEEEEEEVLDLDAVIGGKRNARHSREQHVHLAKNMDQKTDADMDADVMSSPVTTRIKGETWQMREKREKKEKAEERKRAKEQKTKSAAKLSSAGTSRLATTFFSPQQYELEVHESSGEDMKSVEGPEIGKRMENSIETTPPRRKKRGSPSAPTGPAIAIFEVHDDDEEEEQQQQQKQQQQQQQQDEEEAEGVDDNDVDVDVGKGNKSDSRRSTRSNRSPSVAAVHNKKEAKTKRQEKEETNTTSHQRNKTRNASAIQTKSAEEDSDDSDRDDNEPKPRSHGAGLAGVVVPSQDKEEKTKSNTASQRNTKRRTSPSTPTKSKRVTAKSKRAPAKSKPVTLEDSDSDDAAESDTYDVAGKTKRATAKCKKTIAKNEREVVGDCDSDCNDDEGEEEEDDDDSDDEDYEAVEDGGDVEYTPQGPRGKRTKSKTVTAAQKKKNEKLEQQNKQKEAATKAKAKKSTARHAKTRSADMGGHAEVVDVDEDEEEGDDDDSDFVNEQKGSSARGRPTVANTPSRRRGQSNDSVAGAGAGTSTSTASEKKRKFVRRRKKKQEEEEGEREEQEEQEERKQDQENDKVVDIDAVEAEETETTMELIGVDDDDDDEKEEEEEDTSEKRVTRGACATKANFRNQRNARRHDNADVAIAADISERQKIPKKKNNKKMKKHEKEEEETKMEQDHDHDVIVIDTQADSDDDDDEDTAPLATLGVRGCSRKKKKKKKKNNNQQKKRMRSRSVESKGGSDSDAANTSQLRSTRNASNSENKTRSKKKRARKRDDLYMTSSSE